LKKNLRKKATSLSYTVTSLSSAAPSSDKKAKMK
jgi:hypothetical protein